MKIINTDLKRRLITISYRRKLSHLGSVLTAVDIIDDVYKTKEPDEKFILSSGHAGLALYVVLEKYGSKDAEEIYEHHGTHPDRCNDCGIDCSTGSLGHGIGIALGMALADRDKNVYCLLSDGECSEGSVWEALRVRKEQELKNLHLLFNFNGWGAYKKIETDQIEFMIGNNEIGTLDNVKTFMTDQDTERYMGPEEPLPIPFLRGMVGHYKVMNEKEYKEAMEILK